MSTDLLDAINAKTRDAYNLAAERYHELFHNELENKVYDRALLDRFARSFRRDSRVCDAGCGPSGQIGRYIFEKGIPVVGVDISDRCIELARQYNPALQFAQCDMGKLPFAGQTFDGIIAYYSIIDTPKACVPRLFREFHRALKPGGRLLVAVKSGSTDGYLPDLLGIETEIYFSSFTQDEIRSFFELGGYEIEFLEERSPYADEIAVSRIFAVGIG